MYEEYNENGYRITEFFPAEWDWCDLCEEEAHITSYQKQDGRCIWVCSDCFNMLEQQEEEEE